MPFATSAQAREAALARAEPPVELVDLDALKSRVRSDLRERYCLSRGEESTSDSFWCSSSGAMHAAGWSGKPPGPRGKASAREALHLQLRLLLSLLLLILHVLFAFCE